MKNQLLIYLRLQRMLIKEQMKTLESELSSSKEEYELLNKLIEEYDI